MHSQRNVIIGIISMCMEHWHLINILFIFDA